jgi:phosphoglycerate kinase
MQKLKEIPGMDVENKLILLRIDVNSALAGSKVLDSPRFAQAAETIKDLLKNNARLVIIAHQGRPGSKNYLKDLEQHSKILSKKSNNKINYIPDLFGIKAQKAITDLTPGQGILLKNLRSEKEELNPKSARKFTRLIKLFDIYINDAFSNSHRVHSSMVLPPKYLKSYAGKNLLKELRALEKLSKPSGSKVLVLGGAKIEDYIPLLEKVNSRTTILAPGALGNLLLYLQGNKLGYDSRWLSSKYKSSFGKFRRLIKKFKNNLILPEDFAILDKGKRRELLLSDLPTSKKLMDIGSRTLRVYKEKLRSAEFILMKGPAGFSEYKQFSKPTIDLLKEISRLSKSKSVDSIVSGGHLTTTLKAYKIPSTFSHVSSSGGSLVQFLSGAKLPGLEALKRSKK